MDSFTKQAFLNEIKNLKEECRSINLKNQSEIISLEKHTEEFLALNLKDYLDIERIAQKIGREEKASKNTINSLILEEKEKFIKILLTRLSLYEALYSHLEARLRLKNEIKGNNTNYTLNVN